VVEAVHLDLVRAHGGLPGLRDEHALEASLARARHRWFYDDTADLADLAAEYGFGLARNHPFHDGNKRVAFVTMGVFLGLSGCEIEAPEADVVKVMLNLAGGELSQDDMAEWIRSHLKKLGG
jgi:death on curing protein